MVTKNKTPAEVEAVTITMSRETAQAVKQACEEYLRFRMGQFEDFTNEVCCWDYVDKMESGATRPKNESSFIKTTKRIFSSVCGFVTRCGRAWTHFGSRTFRLHLSTRP